MTGTRVLLFRCINLTYIARRIITASQHYERTQKHKRKRISSLADGTFPGNDFQNTKQKRLRYSFLTVQLALFVDNTWLKKTTTIAKCVPSTCLLYQSRGSARIKSRRRHTADAVNVKQP